MGWLDLANDALSGHFSWALVDEVAMKHESKNFYVSFSKF
jgi:hypothetical protein